MQHKQQPLRFIALLTLLVFTMSACGGNGLATYESGDDSIW